jgi:hypothetical protein
MSDSADRAKRDVVALREAVRQLDERNSPHLHIPSPSAEFLLYEIARLLETIAWAVERGEPPAPDVLENAERLARHIHSYIDVYLPATT